MAEKKQPQKKGLTSKLYRLELWFSEGLLVACLILIMTILVFFTVVRINRLPDLATIAPESQTLAFTAISATDYLKSVSSIPKENILASPFMQSNFSTLFGAELNNKKWFSGDLGVIFLKDSTVTLLSTRSRKKTIEYFIDFGMQNPVGKEKSKDSILKISKTGRTKIYSFSNTYPMNFAFFGNMVAISNSIDALQLLAQTKNGDVPSVDSDNDYRNVRSRLPYSASAFIYVNTPQSRKKLIQYASKIGATEPGFLEPVLNVFPAFGATISMEADGWYMESFAAANKSSLKNGLLREETKYEKRFLSWSPENFTFEFGGNNVRTDIDRIRDLVHQTNPMTSLLIDSVLRSKMNKFFGDNTDLESEIYPLMDEEYWFGFNPNNENDFALILGINEEEESKAYNLKDRFVINYRLSKPVTREVKMFNGNTVTELQADLIGMTQETGEHNGIKYSRIFAGDKDIAFIAIRPNTLIMSAKESTLFEILDKMEGASDPRPMYQLDSLISGSEEMMNVNFSKLSQENALFTETRGLSQMMTSRKIFDDGIFSRTSLLFE